MMEDMVPWSLLRSGRNLKHQGHLLEDRCSYQRRSHHCNHDTKDEHCSTTHQLDKYSLNLAFFRLDLVFVMMFTLPTRRAQFFRACHYKHRLGYSTVLI